MREGKFPLCLLLYLARFNVKKTMFPACLWLLSNLLNLNTVSGGKKVLNTNQSGKYSPLSGEQQAHFRGHNFKECRIA